MYGAWYHLKKLEAGEHHVRVTLNTNDHNDLTVQGELVEAFADCRVPDHRMTVYFGKSDDDEQAHPRRHQQMKDEP